MTNTRPHIHQKMIYVDNIPFCEVTVLALFRFRMMYSFFTLFTCKIYCTVKVFISHFWLPCSHFTKLSNVFSLSKEIPAIAPSFVWKASLISSGNKLSLKLADVCGWGSSLHFFKAFWRFDIASAFLLSLLRGIVTYLWYKRKSKLLENALWKYVMAREQVGSPCPLSIQWPNYRTTI